MEGPPRLYGSRAGRTAIDQAQGVCVRVAPKPGGPPFIGVNPEPVNATTQTRVSGSVPEYAAVGPLAAAPSTALYARSNSRLSISFASLRVIVRPAPLTDAMTSAFVRVGTKIGGAGRKNWIVATIRSSCSRPGNAAGPPVMTRTRSAKKGE